MQKGQTLILFLLTIVVAGFVGVIFYTGKQIPKSSPRDIKANSEGSKPFQTIVPNSVLNSETAGPDSIGVEWQTYTDKKNGFLFKYPKEKYLFKESKTDNVFFLQYCPSQKLDGCAPSADYFSGYVYKDALESTIEFWAGSSEFSPLRRENCYLKDPRTSISGVRFNGRPAITYSYAVDAESAVGVCKDKAVEGRGQYYGVITSIKKDIFVLLINSSSKGGETELYKILWTFKFLK